MEFLETLFSISFLGVSLFVNLLYYRYGMILWSRKCRLSRLRMVMVTIFFLNIYCYCSSLSMDFIVMPLFVLTEIIGKSAGFVLACHLELLVDLPTIGIGKTVSLGNNINACMLCLKNVTY